MKNAVFSKHMYDTWTWGIVADIPDIDYSQVQLHRQLQ